MRLPCLPAYLPNGLPASTTGKKAHHKFWHYVPAAGLPIAGNIIEPGFLEGGDFFPMGQDLALVGVGLRSNMEACQQLMDRDLLGTRRLGVVRDDFDRHQVRPTSEDGRGQIGRLCSVLQFDSRLWAWGVDRRVSSRCGGEGGVRGHMDCAEAYVSAGWLKPPVPRAQSILLQWCLQEYLHVAVLYFGMVGIMMAEACCAAESTG